MRQRRSAGGSGRCNLSEIEQREALVSGLKTSNTPPCSRLCQSCSAKLGMAPPFDSREPCKRVLGSRFAVHPSFRAMRFLLASALLALVCFTSGCDIFGDETKYSGIVVDNDTGEPIEGIYVTIRGGSGFPSGTTRLASTFTDDEGRYEISYDGTNVSLYANYVGFERDGVYNNIYGYSLLQDDGGVIRLFRL